jgi:tetratricopeptide (TPR) repeat protein
MRAFLCYSTKDRVLVESVAERLGRALVLFQKFSFGTAPQLLDLIAQNGQKSTIFCLFASTHSFLPDFSKYELDASHHSSIRAKIGKILVIKISDIDSIPVWLQEASIVSLTSSSQIEREIRYQLNQTLQEERNDIFVGRRREIEASERQLAPTDTLIEPHSFCFFGLSGIGRKTLCRKVANDLLQFTKLAIFSLNDGDSIADIIVKMNEDLYPSKNRDAIHNLIAETDKLERDKQLSRFSDLAEQYINAKELLVFQDEGGFLDNDGFVTPDVQNVIQVVETNPRLRLAFISNRKPSFESTETNIPCVRVPQLEIEDIKRLLVRQFRKRKILDAKEDEITELASYIGGYPPAVRFVAEMAFLYGLNKILGDKRVLIDFTASYMLRELSAHERLTELQQKVLVILAYYSPLPLSVIGQCLNIDATHIDEATQYLLDVAFIVPDNRIFRIADPLVNAVIRLFGQRWNSHSLVANALEKFLSTSDDDELRFTLARSLFRAVNYSGVSQSKEAISLTSDLINLSQQFYHDRNYERAIEYCRKAIELRPQNVEIRTYLVRALIQKQQFPAAEKEISEIVNMGQLRDAWFLRGFLSRHRQDYESAIAAYEKSIEHGRNRRGAAINRELAQCYYEIGKLEQAKQYIVEALKSDPDNRYIVDLEIQIAMRLRDRKTAEKRLEILRIADDERFYLHRRSTVRYIFGERELAFEDAKRAFEEFQRPPFAIVSQLIKTEIDTQRFAEAAKHLTMMDESFSDRNHDIRIGLRCKYETAMGNFSDALGLWNRLQDKKKPVHLILKYNALLGLARQEGGSSGKSFTQLGEVRKQLDGLDLGVLDRDFGTLSSDR